MSAETKGPIRTFVLVPEPDLGHAIAKRLREEPGIQVIGVSTDPDKDAYRIFDADPDVIVADYEAGGLDYLYSERLPPGDHRVVFFAPKSEQGCEACYQALVHGAHGIMCRPLSAEEVPHAEELRRSLLDGTLMRPADCPAVKRLRDEEAD